MHVVRVYMYMHSTGAFKPVEDSPSGTNKECSLPGTVLDLCRSSSYVCIGTL